MHEVLQAGFGHQPMQEHVEQLHYCLACRMVFARRSALAVHAFKNMVGSTRFELLCKEPNVSIA